LCLDAWSLPLICHVRGRSDGRQVKDFRDTSGVKQFVRNMGEELAAWTREAGAVARAFAGEFERFGRGPDFARSTEHWIDEAVLAA
jgi:hypothetical protein